MVLRLTSLFLYVLSISGRSSAEGQAQRIAGGTLAKLAQYPHVVYVNVTYDGIEAGCTGCILTDLWVVTAAHCFSKAIRFHKQTYLTSVVAGTIDVENKGRCAQVRKSVRVIVRDPIDFMGSRDIALINVEKPFVFDACVRPIALASEKPSPSPKREADCSMVGYGNTRQRVSHDDVAVNSELYYIKGFVVDCKGVRANDDSWVSEKYVCVDSEKDNQTSCGGDSGAPLVCDGGAATGGGRLVGVLRGRLNADETVDSQCGRDEGVVQVYISIAHYASWIRRHVPQLDSSSSHPRKSSKAAESRERTSTVTIVLTSLCVEVMGTLHGGSIASVLVRET